jgi:SAM-dependent methyltransferase
MEARKNNEREFHDHLRREWSVDPSYTSNKRFYVISESNREYVKQWVSERCLGKRVLDYCCGNGEFALWLAEVGANSFAIDISGASIEIGAKEARCRGLREKVKFSVMDGETTGFPDDSFDLAVVSGVLHHLDLRRSYSELARVLKPDGEVICTEALRHNPVIHLYRKLTPHLRSGWEVEHILGKRDIEAAREYFDRVEIKKFFHLASIAAVPFRKLALFPEVLKLLEGVDSALLRLPFLKWQAWMAVFVLGLPKKRLLGSKPST